MFDVLTARPSTPARSALWNQRFLLLVLRMLPKRLRNGTPLKWSFPLLRHLLTCPDSVSENFRQYVRAYNNLQATGCAKADWVSRLPGSSSCNPTTTGYSRTFHYFGVMVPPTDLRPSFLYVYIHETDFDNQSDVRAARMTNLHPGLLVQLTVMLLECNHYVQSFSALQDYSTPVNDPNAYHTIIYSDKSPASVHVLQYNGPSASKIALNIPGVEDGIIGRQDIVIRRHGELNANGSERFDTILVNYYL